MRALGYNHAMRILHISLDKGMYEDLDTSEYSGSLALELALKLYDRFIDDDPVVIASPSPDSAAFRGSAVFSVVFRSPITSRISAVFSNLSPGYSMRRLGIDAIAITGRARKLSSIALSKDAVSIESAEGYAGVSADSFGRVSIGSPTDSYLAIGRAGENAVIYASVIAEGREIPSDGLGYAFGIKNLKGITMPGFHQPSSEKKEWTKMERKLERSRALRDLRLEGSCRIIDSALRLGWLPVNGYRDRFDPRAYFLDGKALMDRYGIMPSGCNDCIVSCIRRNQEGNILPDWRECAFLGANLGFFSPESVRKLRDAAIEEGLDTAYTGAVLASLTELSDPMLPSLEGDGIEEYLRVIHMIGGGMDYGRKLSKGIPGGIKSADGRVVSSDLRGSFPDAIASMYSFPIVPIVSDYLPHKPLSPEASAVMALYESVYTLYLASMGYSPFPVLASWFGRFPSWIYRFPVFLRIIASGFRAYGIKGSDMLERGLMLLGKLSLEEPQKIPERFVTEFNGRTVPESRLISYFSIERSRLEEKIQKRHQRKGKVRKGSKDRRDINDKPESSSNAADGPSDDLGRDGDPGLHI